MNKWQELKDFTSEHQCEWSHKPEMGAEQWGIHLQDPPPHNRLLGPVFDRGKTCGLVEIAGKRVCEWGDRHRADMTFSVTKTYLALVAGRAFDTGLITDLDHSVLETLQQRKLPTLGFADSHNEQVTWRQMLQFTSEWQGSCFGIPDQVDHHRIVSMQAGDTLKQGPAKGEPRVLQKPGTYWEYNDVRINQFSLALLHLFGRALPDILDEHFMQPLHLHRAKAQNPTDGWHWHGYENSWVTIDDKFVQSVPGGGHWGGGMVISAEAQAAIARMMLSVNDQNSALLSDEWRQLMLQPTDIAPWYGFFTWLNTDHCISKAASSNSFFAMGIGGQVILHDPDAQLLAVFRWIDAELTSDIVELTYSVAKA